LVELLEAATWECKPGSFGSAPLYRGDN